jgi:lipoate-protein ligase A
LVRVDAVCEQQKLAHIHISGDFFVHPEEALTRIEHDLDGLGIDGNETDLEQRIVSVVSATGAQLIGFGVTDLADLLRELRC